MAQQFLDARSHLVAFGPQGLDFFGEVRIRGLRFRVSRMSRRQFLQRGVLLLPQTVDQRDGLLDALLKMTERIDFLLVRGVWLSSDGRHFYWPGAARAVFTCAVISANCEASAVAVSARTLRSRSMPASFRPCMNLL